MSLMQDWTGCKRRRRGKELSSTDGSVSSRENAWRRRYTRSTTRHGGLLRVPEVPRQLLKSSASPRRAVKMRKSLRLEMQTRRKTTPEESNNLDPLSAPPRQAVEYIRFDNCSGLMTSIASRFPHPPQQAPPTSPPVTKAASSSPHPGTVGARSPAVASNYGYEPQDTPWVPAIATESSPPPVPEGTEDMSEICFWGGL